MAVEPPALHLRPQRDHELVGPEGGIVTRFSSDALVGDITRALRRLIDPAGS